MRSVPNNVTTYADVIKRQTSRESGGGLQPWVSVAPSGASETHGRATVKVFPRRAVKRMRNGMAY